VPQDNGTWYQRHLLVSLIDRLVTADRSPMSSQRSTPTRPLRLALASESRRRSKRDTARRWASSRRPWRRRSTAGASRRAMTVLCSFS
jgi:hypothetical protein